MLCPRVENFTSWPTSSVIMSVFRVRAKIEPLSRSRFWLLNFAMLLCRLADMGVGVLDRHSGNNVLNLG